MGYSDLMQHMIVSTIWLTINTRAARKIYWGSEFLFHTVYTRIAVAGVQGVSSLGYGANPK